MKKDKVTTGINITGSFRFGEAALFGPIDLAINPGGWACLLGPSGVGKSTVLRLVAGLETGGQFDGMITATDGQPLTDRISYMAQTDLLFPWLDVLENVTLGARLRGDTADEGQAWELIERVGLKDHAHKKPLALSGGMRQRVALARTLMEDRPIALLDEPMSALDACTRAEMQELAGEMLSGKTVLLVTHDPAEAARLGHDIILMTANGLTHMPVPELATVRSAFAPETLQCEGALLQSLLEGRA